MLLVVIVCLAHRIPDRLLRYFMRRRELQTQASVGLSCLR